MRIGVLSVQGAFIEQEQRLARLGATCIELRKAEDLEEPIDGLVLPGGESTVQGKLLRELFMLEPLKKKIEEGLPVFATCAGLILLAEAIDGGEWPHFGTLPVTVKRNAYGRQLGSFHVEEEFKGLGKIPMTFIRAPYVSQAGDGVEVLAEVQDRIVAVKYKNQLALAFHPELDEDQRLHSMFIKMIEETL